MSACRQCRDRPIGLDELASDTGDSGLNPFDHNGLEHWGLIDFHDLFLAGAGADSLSRLVSQWTSLNPEVTGVDGTAEVDDNGDPLLEMPHWGDPGDIDLFDTDPWGNPEVSSDDVDQGMVGDCWMLAKTGALTHLGGTWATDHVRENPNGTVTVTMYDGDGNPHQVTVTRDLPLNDSGDRVFAGNDGSSTPGWNGYYEKAFALASQHGSDDESGYGGIEGGWGQDDATLMTGHPADELDTDYDDVREAYESGHPVVVGTEHDDGPDGRTGWVGGHEFYLKGYDSDGNMMLGNPWGSTEPDLVVTPDEFEDYFNNAAALNP